MNLLTRSIALMGLSLLLMTCDLWPSARWCSGDREVFRSTQDGAQDFAAYQVTRAFLPTVAQWPATGKQKNLHWIGHSRGARTQIIQLGDKLTLRIWDKADNSLLTSTDEKVIQMADVVVATNGSVSIPYVGNISVIGNFFDAFSEVAAISGQIYLKEIIAL